jgi:hypothetical protein
MRVPPLFQVLTIPLRSLLTMASLGTLVIGGLIPREHSFGGKQRLGSIREQGSWFMRQLPVEAVQPTCCLDEGFRRQYQGPATTR